MKENPVAQGPTGGQEGFGRLGPSIVTAVPGPASVDLARRLARVESRNVTYLGPDFPVFWDAAAGANVRDADGNVFVDLTAAFGVAVAGHAHPRITEAIRAQAGRLAHGMGDVHPPVRKVELLERLAGMAPWPSTRGILANSGSEAVEAALKTAQLRTGRPGIIAFRGGYHGLTLGSLAVTARSHFREPFTERLFRGVRFIPFPDGPPATAADVGASAEDSLRALDEAFEALERAGSPAGCVILEVIQGRGGVRVPPPGFLATLAARVRDRDALLVLDEIFTGFGRTGTRFAFEAEGVVPDLLCVGKALGGGLPLSACLGPESIMDAWPLSAGEAIHTSTFLGHPLACTSAMAFLDVLEDERLAERALELGKWARGRLERGLSGCGRVREVRGRGLFLGVELSSPGDGAEVATEALRRGLILLPAGDQGEVVEITPPLVITESQLGGAIDLLVDIISR